MLLIMCGYQTGFWKYSRYPVHRERARTGEGGGRGEGMRKEKRVDGNEKVKEEAILLLAIHKLVAA